MPWKGIKSKLPALVKAAALAILLGCVLSPLAQAKSEDLDPKSQISPEELENLPEIRARAYKLKVARRSNSNRVYLFEDIENAHPKIGRILLLKKAGEPVMAFRLIKLYEDKKQVAGKRVRRYKGYKQLRAGDTYQGYEKVGDVAILPHTAQDKADLKELEGGGNAPSFDSELDSKTDTDEGEEKTADPSLMEEDEEDVDRWLSLTAEEVFPIDTTYHGLTAQFGYLRNFDVESLGTYFAGGGIRYGLTLGRMLFLRKSNIQDTITVEGGVFLYKVLNYRGSGDSFTVLPLIGTVRYNLLLGENFTLFGYGGYMKNRVIQNGTEDLESAAILSSGMPAIGGGIMFRAGPHWHIRIDAGLDMIGAGLVLRF